jgi:class 3 adenylate cyclase
MLAFPSATQALHCAIAMQQGMESAADGTPIRLRIGVHTGEPIREADQFFGESVIIAARVSALAQGAEILASELVVQLTRPSAKFDFDEPRTVELKGIGGIHLVYPVSWHPA